MEGQLSIFHIKSLFQLVPKVVGRRFAWGQAHPLKNISLHCRPFYEGNFFDF